MKKHGIFLYTFILLQVITREFPLQDTEPGLLADRTAGCDQMVTLRQPQRPWRRDRGTLRREQQGVAFIFHRG